MAFHTQNLHLALTASEAVLMNASEYCSLHVYGCCQVGELHLLRLVQSYALGLL
jgi:hypothetical protein